MVWINPWELARLAAQKGLTSRIFRDTFCELGGIRLKFNKQDSKNRLAECSQYLPGCGCSVHAKRPLVCRLYPLGRVRHDKKIFYMHRGNKFPCLDDCPEVLNLPDMTVSDYLAGQDISSSATAQDEYLELMQQLADNAFALLFESNLAASGDRLTLHLWREIGDDFPEDLAKRIGADWLDLLMLPDINDDLSDPAVFCRRHQEILQAEAQKLFCRLTDESDTIKASGLMMGMALHLGRGLGADPPELAKHWIATAKKLGAQEQKP
jgi:Fe-S-cluster containining protein